MAFIMRDESFHCLWCGQHVSRHPSGSARNHCPFCLCSLHVDDAFPWDRASSCHALMRPIGTDWRKGKGIVIVQQCTKCFHKNVNILAEDDCISEFMRQQNA